jgi:TPR repeat protein
MATPRKLMNAANKGIADAQYQLAAMLATGDLGKKDIAKAAEWYAKAAAEGHPEATHHIGLIHLLGELGQSKKRKGTSLLKLAAELGSWDAQWFLAEMYRKGLFGATSDIHKAFYYLILAMRAKYPQALLAMADMVRSEQSSSPASTLAAFVSAVRQLANGKAKSSAKRTQQHSQRRRVGAGAKAPARPNSPSRRT